MDSEQLLQAVQSGITPFALTTYRNMNKVFGIKTDDRRRHVYLIGKTGMGKTTLIENMVYADILAGHGVCYIDPHGDTAEKMLQWIPTSRINDVIYFNPADINYPISFNVLEKVAPEYRHLVSSGLIGVFKKQWADSWGPRLEYILRNAILALLEYPDSTLLGINRILVDKAYRNKVLEKVHDPVVKSFWVDEFSKWNDRVLQEVISPIQNKVGQFLSTALIRNLVGQVKSSIDLRKVMDEGKILILNLSKGRIGEDASAMLGAMMVTKIQLAAMSRVDILEEQRNDFYLYVDEFQNFVTDAFANILSEARKYHLNLIIAHQYIEQLGEVVKPAVFGNVGTLITFRIGAEDAEFLEKEFAPDIIQEDLVNLPKYNFYLKLMIDGIASEPFSAKGLPPVFTGTMGNEEKVIKVSRERYAKERELVEDKIRRWSLGEKEKKEAAAEKESGETFDKRHDRRSTDQPRPARTESKPATGRGDKRSSAQKKSDAKPGFKANCFNCKKEIEVPFKPDNVRPVFCQDCLKKARRGDIPLAPAVASEQLTSENSAVSLEKISQQTVNFKGQPAVSKKEQTQSRSTQLRPVQSRPNQPKPVVSQPRQVQAKPTTAPVKSVSVPPQAPKLVQDKVVPAPVKQSRSEPLSAPIIFAPLAPKPPEVSQPVIVKPEPRIEQPQPQVRTERLPSADLLGQQNEDRSVKPGDVIEL